VTPATALRVAAWLLLAGLVFVTLSPVDLRPISPLPTQLERAIALSVVGFVFAFAYPRSLVLVAALVLGATVALEAAQLMTPSRHGGWSDVAVKLLGGCIGLAAGWMLNRTRSPN
jgi:hypothetical protein